MADPLARDYGVLLGIAGPILLDRSKSYREMAELIGPGPAADWLELSAQRAEDAIKAMGRKFNERRS